MQGLYRDHMTRRAASGLASDRAAHRPDPLGAIRIRASVLCGVLGGIALSLLAAGAQI